MDIEDNECGDTIQDLGAPSKVATLTIPHPAFNRLEMHDIKGEHLGIPNDQVPKFTDPGYF